MSAFGSCFKAAHQKKKDIFSWMGESCWPLSGWFLIWSSDQSSPQFHLDALNFRQLRNCPTRKDLSAVKALLAGPQSLFRGQEHFYQSVSVWEFKFRQRRKSDNFNTLLIASAQRKAEVRCGSAGCACFGLRCCSQVSHLIHDWLFCPVTPQLVAAVIRIFFFSFWS